MTSIIGGYDTGLFDSSLFLLNRDDKTAQGSAGHGEDLYVNIANGNLLITHKDAYLPSQGDDYFLARTYNSRGTWGGTDGPAWSNNSTVLELSQITSNKITLVNADSSRFVFTYDAASDSYISVDGAGAYEVIKQDKVTKSWVLTKSDQTLLSFDGNGDLKTSRDPNGNVISYVFSQGKLQSLKDDAGHTITYSYTNGNLVKVQDELGTVLVQYEYTQNLLSAVIDRSGDRTTYQYNTDGTIKSITLPATTGEQQRVLQFSYDPDPTDTSGRTRLLRWLTDAEGNKTYFEYRFNVDNFSKYNGGTTTVLNALGLNRRESNAAEYVQWRIDNGLYATWDAARYAADAGFRAQADQITDRHTVSYSYNSFGAITSVVDQAGYRTVYQYDAKENLTAITDANGFAITSSDASNWRQLRAEYGFTDLAGQGKLVADLSSADIAALQARYTTGLEYDSRGNLVRKTDNLGNVTSFTYAAFNKVTSQTSAMGHALATSDDASVQDKRFELGYALSASALTDADRAALRALYTTTYTYDARQNVTEIRSPGGDLTRFEYDSFGNLSRRIAFLDANDLVDPARQQVTQFFYDAFGQNIRTVDAEGFTTTKTFDHFGNVLSVTDGRGNVTRFTYDADNRLLTVTSPEGSLTSPEGSLTTYSYDSVGNRTAVRDAGGHSVIYVYDRNNLLVTTIDPAAADASGNRVTSASYDVVGNRTRTTDAEGRVATYVYREDNRLLEVRTPAVQGPSGSGTASYTTSYAYDGVGQQIAVTDFNGNRTDFVYNEDGLLKRRTDATGNVTEYRYDANLNQIQVVIGAQLATERRRVLRFAFDEEDQKISETDALGGQVRYARDAVGNVVATTDANGHQTDYRFDRNNRLVTEVRPQVLDAATGLETRHTVTHQYDGNGNQVATTDENGHSSRLTFDKDNRLVMVEDGNGIKTVYSYDPRNNRTSVQIGVEATVDASGRVLVTSSANAQVQTFGYDEFNRLVSQTDGVGNALVSSDSALYATMRQQMGYAAAVANLSTADRQAILAAYTERLVYDKVDNVVSRADHEGRVTRIAYDGLNRMTSRTDALGQTALLRYDGNGNQVGRTDELGRVTSASYDALDRVLTETDALGVVSRNSYDNVGNLLSKVQAEDTAEARTSRFEYDLNNRLLRSTDPQGANTAYEYDAVGNRLRVVDARGNATQYVYDARDRIIRTIDPLGFQTRVEYDGVGNRLTLVDARGSISRLQYDAGNRLIQTTDAEGRVSRLEYDVRGNRVTQRTGAGTADEQVTRFEYDAQGNLRAVIDGEGARSENGFDRVYNRTSVTDGNGHTSRYEFDALNRQLRMVDAEGQQTLFAYDAVGNTLRRTDALGRVNQFAYDADDRVTTVTAADGVVTRYAYDAVDNRIALTRAAGLPEQQVTVYAYDRNGRLLSETDALGHTRHTEYDANGNAVATVDALGQRTTYTYDANNRVIAIADPLGQTTRYAYDGNGNRVQVIDALGQASTSYFNLDNELSLAVNAAGEATSLRYDANGNVVAQTRHAVRLPQNLDPAVRPILVSDGADQVTRYAYDHVNRAVRTLDAEGGLVDSSYDAAGNLVTVTAYAAKVQLASGQQLSAVTVQPQALDRVTRHAYDAVDRRIESVDAEGYTTRFEYDAVGNRRARTLFLSKTDFGTPALQERTVFAFDAVNRLVSETSPIGVQAAFAYDALGNLLQRTDAAGTADARSTSYSYDAANRRLTEVDALGTVTRFTYDEADRLVRTVRADGLPEARSTSYAYDAANRLVETQRPDGSIQRSVYDAIGRVTEQVDAAGSASERRTAYSYDRVGRVVSTTLGVGTPEALVTTSVYDAFGNRTRSAVAEGTSSARVMRYAYDHVDRLIAQTDGNGIVTLNDYDAFGNRVATSITGETQTALGTAVQRTWSMQFAYDGRNLLVGESDGAGNVIRREYDAAGNLRFQHAGVDSTAAQTTEFAYDLANRLLRKTVDPSGLAISTAFEYDARGNLVAQTDAEGIVSRARFDALDRAVLSTDGEGFSVSFAYDRFGNQTAITTGQYLPVAGEAGYDADKAARAMPATTLLAYDAMDRKVLQADALGTVTRHDYDLRGNRIRTVEAAGSLPQGAALTESSLQPLVGTEARTSVFRHDAADRLVDEVQPLGTVVHHEYNAAGELTAKVVDHGQGPQYRNATTRYFHDAGGRLQFSADPLGVVTQTVYDGFGNVVRTVRGLALDAEGQPSTTPTADMRVTAYEYDIANRRTAEVVDPHGLALRTSYELDVRGRQTAVIDGNGNRTEMAYDAADRMVWLRDGEGFVSTVAYDGRGLRTAETRYASNASGLAAGALPAASSADRHATMAYDAAGRMTEAVDARGVVTRMAYDAIGNRTRTIENATGQLGSLPRETRQTFNAANLLTSKTDAADLVCDYSYDAVYNMTERREHNTWTGGEQVQVTRYTHDLNNRLTDEIVDPAGLNLHKAYRYDTLGNRVAEISANGSAAAEANPAQRQAILDAHTRRTWFDAASRAVLTVDENGSATSTRYDAVGNAVQSTRHATTLTLAQRQALDDLTPAVLAPHVDDRSTERELDKADREVLVRTAAVRQALGQVFLDDYRAETRTRYDAVGNVVSTVDGNGNTSYAYYDGNNRLRGRMDAEGYLTVLTLDAFGNAVEERLTLDRPALSASQKPALDLDTYALQGEVRLVTRSFDAGDHETLTLYPASELVDSDGSAEAHAQVVRKFDAFGQIASESVLHRIGTQGPATHYRYDAAGRLASKTDPQADELLSSDAPEIIGLRKQLGYVTDTGAGKPVEQLTPDERAQIEAAYRCDYSYDAKGNVREQVEAGRRTSFEYDAANRSTRVLYPAVARTEVDAEGVVIVTHDFRAEGRRVFDANGNVLSELKPDGERIDYRFDAGNRMVAALNDGVLVTYAYNFAGDLTRMHRYFNTAGSLDTPPPVNFQQDQVIERLYDRLGRRVAEIQLGDLGDGSDDRVLRSAYDANGNAVQSTDARGFTSRVVYDALNRVTDTVNREGGVTGSDYDALGNVVARRTGGFNAPQLLGGVTESVVSDRGLIVEWTTDHATDGQVLVRPAGSGADWTSFGTQGAFTQDHFIRLDGLAADTLYEYRFVSKDSFGYTIESEVRTVRTSVGLAPVAVSDVRQVGAAWEARLSFTLPPGATGAVVRVGNAGADVEATLQPGVFTPVLQADGSYSVLLAYENADASFQVEWTDATGLHRTGASAIQQKVDTRRLDVAVKAVPQGNNTFTLSTSWNLADVLADGGIAFADTPEGPSYSVYVGFTRNAGQTPNWTQATLQGGLFKAQFANLAEGARTLFLQYVKQDGSIVNATPIPISALAGLDLRYQNLELDFPGVDLQGTQLSVRTRKVGDTAWTDVAATAISGTSVNLLGLPAGQYEYEATLTRGGTALRNASGRLELREPASLSGLKDTLHPQAEVPFTLTDTALELSGPYPLADDEAVTLELRDEQGALVPTQFADGVLDVAALVPGSYALQVTKARTVTTTTSTGTPPVDTTTTTTIVLSRLEATLVVGPLTLSKVEAQALSGTRVLTSYAPDATRTTAASVQVSGTSSADHSWSFYDVNGRRTFSNEEGGVWTRYFHDAAGNVTREVRFQRRDAQQQFINAITDGDRPSLADLQADYDAAVAAQALGVATARITLRTFDAANNVLTETESTKAHGDVTTRTAWDKFRNKIVETSAEGLPGLENTVRSTYDAANRLVRVETGPFEHFEGGPDPIASSVHEDFEYDARGNQTLHKDARGFEVRRHFDALGRMAREWDGSNAAVVSTLRTDYVYDGFDRVIERRAVNLSTQGVQGAEQVTRYEWSAFDQQTRMTDALGHATSRFYDGNGNVVSETDANGATARYNYDAENRLNVRIDRLGGVWTTTYDAYGQRLAETDANGRVTAYNIGAFGQVLGSQTYFTRGYGTTAAVPDLPQGGGWIADLVRRVLLQAAAATSSSVLEGAASSSETMRYDWNGRLAQAQDSFGKNLAYSYNDADEQIRIDDFALGKSASYEYDALGRRTHEVLDRGGLTQRDQSYTYNNQGWLSSVVADAGFDAGGGASLSQKLNVTYRFDAAGNRVRVESTDQFDANKTQVGEYTYDASGRMLTAVDDTPKEVVVVQEVRYDGFGNRVHEKRGTVDTAYSYDAANRVVSSSAGEEWKYDANGNTVFQRSEDTSQSTTQYNAENRATVTTSVDKDRKTTTSRNTYDAVGNVIDTRVDGDGFGFNEVTKRDVRYLETSKRITNSFAKGAKGLEGASSFTYDANGNLAVLDRGRSQSGESGVAFFDYDIDGHILGRADKASALAQGDFFQGFNQDPRLSIQPDEFGVGTNVLQSIQAQQGGSTKLQSYIYANNKPIAEASGELQMVTKVLSLIGGIAVSEGVLTDASEPVFLGYDLALQPSDLKFHPDGVTLDRTATARAIAERAYSGWIDLSPSLRDRVTAYVEGQLPADVGPTTKVRLFGFIVVAESTLTKSAQITDYSYREIGTSMPGGTVQNHVVRAGDSLQSVAAMYFGSPAYWYLIADANGLTGTEALTAGTVLKIPNVVANSVNDKDTFKVYNESEIIGSTSPEIRTIKKKKKWYQKLIQIIIVVILVVAAVFTAGAAMGIAAGGAGSLTGLLAMGANFAASLGAVGLTGVAAVGAAAAIGAGVYAAASVLTQGLAVAADLQDKFSWRSVGKAAISGAISGAASFLGAAGGLDKLAGVKTTVATAKEVGWGVRVAIEAGRQVLTDGKISNVAGLLGAAAGGGAFGPIIKGVQYTFSAGLSMVEGRLRGRGDNAMDWVNLATAALFDKGLVSSGLYEYAEDGKAIAKLNWDYVAAQAVGAAIIASRRGEDASLNYLGNSIGQGISTSEYASVANRKAENAREKALGNASGQSSTETASSPGTQMAASSSAPRPGGMGSGSFGVDQVDDLMFARFAGSNAAALASSGAGTQGASVPTLEFGASERDFRERTEGNTAGNGYRAVVGDSISTILGTSNPQAIGNFMRANGLTNSTIEAGRDYFVPESTSSYGDSAALGQAVLNGDNARLNALATERGAQQQEEWDELRTGKWGGRTGEDGPVWHGGDPVAGNQIPARTAGSPVQSNSLVRAGLEGTRDFIDGGYGRLTGEAWSKGEYGKVAQYSILGAAFGTLNVLSFGEAGAVTNGVRAVSREMVAGQGGRFAEFIGTVGDDLTAHHIPQAALKFTDRADGGAIVMTSAEHAATRTYMGKGKLTMVEDAGESFRKVLAKDIQDVRQIVGTAYNQGLRDVIKYYRERFPDLMKK